MPLASRLTTALLPRISVLIAASLIILALAATPVHAEIITVGGGCTLAEAIANANNDNNGNNNGCAAGSGADTINLTGNITLTAALPDIRSNITINGGNHTVTRTDRLVTIWGPALGTTPETYGAITVTINKLQLTNTSTANDRSALLMSNNASVEINDSRFYNMASHEVRGTVLVQNYSAGSLTINKSVFEGNTNTNDSSGGAALWLNGTTTINNSTFKNNSAEYSGGALYVDAGAVVKINESAFTGNKSTHREGGAIYTIGDGDVTKTPSNPQLTISNSLFSNNTAGLQSTGTFSRDGGAIDSGANPTNIYGSYFAGNEAGDHGGAVYQENDPLRLENSTFYDNEAANEGGAFYSVGGTANIRHVTFVDNEAVGSSTVAKNGNAVFFESGVTANLYNSIIKTTASHNGNDCAGADTIQNNIIQDGSCSHSSNITDDPLLGSRVTPSNKRAYYPLQAGSPAFNAADPTQCGRLRNPVDQRGAARPYPSRGACDVGAYEWYPPPPEPRRHWRTG